ncbi:MAG: DUF1851 domain-containing protein [Bifidobacteriaceae bacterium]|jgi:hypothetical protein|nr:DUF1851 domain-containing protein [Bifidobacteriaceae bacterium]
MALVVDPVQGDGGTWVPRRGPRVFADAGYCGRSFNQGVLRFHDSTTGPNYRGLCFDAFPELSAIDRRADVLAFDWNGKQYLTAKVRGQKQVMILVADLGTGSVEPLSDVSTFAGVLKEPNMAEYFSGDLYDEWRNAVERPEAQLAFTDCVEYTMPLYLGGLDSIENLQLIDLDVSWTIGAQIRSQTPKPPKNG